MPEDVHLISTKIRKRFARDSQRFAKDSRDSQKIRKIRKDSHASQKIRMNSKIRCDSQMIINDSHFLLATPRVYHSSKGPL
jgi:hypothetical protein